MVFRNMRVYAGGTPVFWLPYLSQPMDDELGYTFSPGYDSVWGAYLLNRYGTLLGEDGHTLATFHLDLRSERGIAGGVDFRSTRHGGDSNFGKLRSTSPTTSTRPCRATAASASTPPEENRYRASLQHRFYLRGYDDSVAVHQETGRGSKPQRRAGGRFLLRRCRSHAAQRRVFPRGLLSPSSVSIRSRTTSI
jgi:LPS-assembly protein